jgi:type IV pilus assembly protein PilE
MENRKLESFTLQELLIVLVIISILILLALPNLMPLISRAKSTEAKLQLEHIYTLQKHHFMEHSKYSKNLGDIYFDQEELNNENEQGKANYQISIEEANRNYFLAKAIAIVDFDGDGQFNEWSIDSNRNLREITSD